MGKLKFSILSISLMLSVFVLQAQDWKLALDKEEIKIYTRSQADSKIKALKVICSLEARLSQMAAVFLDIKKQDEWFYHTKSTLLLQVSPSELYYYSVVYFPMPFSNRDFAEHIKVSQNTDSKILILEVENVPDYILCKQGVVRIIHSNCKWVVTPVRENLISIEFTLFVDPGGSIPSWLVNMFSKLGPFETFKKLKLQINKPEYKNVHLPFVID